MTQHSDEEKNCEINSCLRMSAISLSLMMTLHYSKTLIRYMEDHNIPTKPASNRAELIRHLTGTFPSLTILDLQPGQDDGLDLLREIRSHSDVPVIITSGHRSDEIDPIVGLELGADDYLVKPFGNCSPASMPDCGGRRWSGLGEMGRANSRHPVIPCDWYRQPQSKEALRRLILQ